jgi:hypothetical protein
MNRRDPVSISLSAGYAVRTCALCGETKDGGGFLVLRRGEFTPAEVKHSVCYACVWNSVVAGIDGADPVLATAVDGKAGR